ncbi:MAG: histidine phosphatase family protein [Pontiella sp.]
MKPLKNKYYAFRHGQSRANVEGIIISNPAVGTIAYGLTEVGRQQVATRVASATDFDADSVIISSDFLRTRETAEIVRAKLGAAEVILEERLRERFFGEWEGKSHTNYSEAWKTDSFDPDRVYHGAESSRSVQERMWSVIQSLEVDYAKRTIILVSHGDPLMLLQTAFKDLGPDKHRALPYIETASWRLLTS